MKQYDPTLKLGLVILFGWMAMAGLVLYTVR
jgi:hypothetical protein